MADLSIAQVMGQLEAWRKEGAACRDTPGSTSPYQGNTLAHYSHSQGWLQRDLQLALARSSPHYRASQLASGSITKEGIIGGYGFEAKTVLVGNIE